MGKIVVKCRFSMLLVFLAVLSVSCGNNYVFYRSVEGTVINFNDLAPVSGVRIVISGADPPFSFTAMTDSSGKFKCDRIPVNSWDGVFYIRASIAGYLDYNQSFGIWWLNPESPLQLTIKLLPSTSGNLFQKTSDITRSLE